MGRDFGGYSLTDASIRYDTGRFGALNLAVQNLFNKDYIDYNSQTRSYDALSYFAGRGRSFTLGWDYRF